MQYVKFFVTKSKLSNNFSKFHWIKRCMSTKKNQEIKIENIRNIGILAHIDAGKTTTTERMLYYAGLIKQMGEVHHGNTVTDYMVQERERGITITSAAVTFYWRQNQFNLIDTPGHIDFTMEVEQTLPVLDGAIVVLDASAGVEAQTLTVWRQADKYKIPRIIFLNKMDRNDANVDMCCKSVEKKLESACLVLQLPVLENGKFVGIIDILSMELLKCGTSKDNQLVKEHLTEKKHAKYWNDAISARAKLIDKLTDYDDELANLVITSNSVDSISTVDIVKALRESTFKQVAVPVLLGSSFKNIGVQSLMDAVILYLPAPNERNKHFSIFEDNLCAKAFKVIHDKQKGPLVFCRIYNGILNKGQKIYSIRQECSEQNSRLYIAYADDFKEVECIQNGNIAVLSGLKRVMSGDLITTSNSASQKAKRNLMKLAEKDGEIHERDLEKLIGLEVTPPEPVFFCSIEPPSLSYQKALEHALSELQREDPSLRVTHNPETGQTVLAGMGELHLEIIRDRILNEYKVDADLGPLQIAYRETPLDNKTDSLTIETKIAKTKQFITVKLSVLALEENHGIKDFLKLDKNPEAASNIAAIFPKHLMAVRRGIEVGLSHGAKISCQVVNTQVMLHYLEVGKGTSETMIAAAVTQLVQKILKEVGTAILEPIMNLEIVVAEEYLSPALADLSRRRSTIDTIGVRGNSKVIITRTPLSELLGYSTVLRTLSSGTATFTMEFSNYVKMSSSTEIIAIKNVRGF